MDKDKINFNDMDNSLKELIEDISNDKVDIFNNKEDCIYFLIDMYSDDICEEFCDFVKENNAFKLSLYDYIDDFYSDKIYEIEGVFLVDTLNYLDENAIKRLFKIVGSKDIDDLRDFCNKLIENQ